MATVLYLYATLCANAHPESNVSLYFYSVITSESNPDDLIDSRCSDCHSYDCRSEYPGGTGL